MGTGGHNIPIVKDNFGKIRNLTPRECARLQGFPDNFKFLKNKHRKYAYMQIGNSVSVPIIKKIAQQLKRKCYD